MVDKAEVRTDLPIKDDVNSRLKRDSALLAEKISNMEIGKAQKLRLKAWLQNQLGKKINTELIKLTEKDPSALVSQVSFLFNSKGFNVTITTGNKQSTFFRVEPGRWWGVNIRWPTFIANILSWFGFGNKSTADKKNQMPGVKAAELAQPRQEQEASNDAGQAYKSLLVALATANRTAGLNQAVKAGVSKSEKALFDYEEAVSKLSGALVGMEDAADVDVSEQEFEEAREKVHAALKLVKEAEKEVNDLNANEGENYQQIVEDHTSCLRLYSAIMADRYPEPKAESRVDQEEGVKQTDQALPDNDSDDEYGRDNEQDNDGEQDDSVINDRGPFYHR